jgi:cobalt/nickel transport system permease protein
MAGDTVLAMHMSDGLVNAPTAAACGLLAVAGMALAATRARSDLDERTAPMAGLVTPSSSPSR